MNLCDLCKLSFSKYVFLALFPSHHSVVGQDYCLLNTLFLSPTFFPVGPNPLHNVVSACLALSSPQLPALCVFYWKGTRSW